MDLGLAYSSSDEDEVQEPIKSQNLSGTDPSTPRSTDVGARQDVTPASIGALTQQASLVPPQQPSPDQAALNGPASQILEGPPASVQGPTEDIPPGSPYTSIRAMVQNLTLPTVPNFDIPPSPPGSPPLKSTNKFGQFLDLKKKGQHFNRRLESSAVLRDPGHLQKLMDYAGMNELDQYASALADGIAVPPAFPRWAYHNELNTAQNAMRVAKEEERRKNPRSAIDFVAADAPGAPSEPKPTTPKHLVPTRETDLPEKGKEADKRGDRSGSSSRGRRSRSRSPKRGGPRSRERR